MWSAWASSGSRAPTFAVTNCYRRFIDLRTERPADVVAVPHGCRAYCTLRTVLGVARRLMEPPVLRTGWRTRLTGLGRNPLRKLTIQTLPVNRLKPHHPASIPRTP